MIIYRTKAQQIANKGCEYGQAICKGCGRQYPDSQHCRNNYWRCTACRKKYKTELNIKARERLIAKQKGFELSPTLENPFDILKRIKV